MRVFFKIFTGLLVFCILFIFCDILFFKYTFYKQLDLYNAQEEILDNLQKSPKAPNYFIKLNQFKNVYKSAEFRPIQNPESKKNPIIIFGCSYAAGYIFDNKETISYVISKHSKRPIINRAVSGWGIAHALYQLKEDFDFFSSIKKPKYIFYVLITGQSHFERMFYTSFPDILNDEYYFTYKLKDNDLIENKPVFNLYYSFAIPRHIYNHIIKIKVTKDFNSYNKKLFNTLVIHFKEMNKIIKQRFGNETKFVILTFENTRKELWAPQLEKEGIDVVDIAETLGIENLSDSSYGFFEPEIAGHPNGKLWHKFIPELKKIYPDL